MWSKFKALSAGRKVAIVIGVLVVLGAIGGTSSSNQNSINSSQATPSKQNQTNSNLHEVQSVNVQVKTVTQTQPVPFQTTTQNDSTLVSGTTKIATAGVNGVETITYKVTYTNGVETNREKVSDVITTQPVTQVTAIGTYVAPACPNGTYVNSAGNTVCSPYSAPSAPAGATAQCRDGTYSFSQSRSGTCSHHGGVATWL
jgi:hypothetical protein